MTERRLSSSYFRSGSASPTKGSTFNLYREESETDYCKRCNKYIYPLELMGPVMGHKYHKLCFRCHTCDRLLDFINYRTNLIDLNDKQLYCVNHHPRNGKYTDSLLTYRAGAKSPAHFESHEYSSEYHYREMKSQEKFSYGNIPNNLEDNLFYKNHLNKSTEGSLNITHDVGFLNKDRFDFDERQRVERERELQLQREREQERLDRELEIEREKERQKLIELEKEREKERLKLIEMEKEREKERLKLIEIETNRERERLRAIEIKMQQEMERERLELARQRERELEEERLRQNVMKIRQESLEENSVENHLVNILTNIRQQNMSSSSSSNVIISSATKDFHDVKEIPVHLNDSFNETHEIRILPASSYSNLGKIILEAKHIEETSKTSLPVYHVESNENLPAENLKDIFQEVRMADMNRSDASHENLRDIFYEAALATMNRSDWSFASNQDDSLEIQDDQKDQDLKNIFWEANQANESRGTTTIVHSHSKENLNWGQAVQSYNSYSEQSHFVQKQTYESTVISSGQVITSSQGISSDNVDIRLTDDQTPPPNLKKMMAEALNANNQSTVVNKPGQQINVQVADPENLSNVKKVITDIQKFEGYKSPDLSIPDTEGMSNLKKIVSEMIHTDVSVPVKKETPRPMIRQNSDGRTLEEIRPEIIGENKGFGVVRVTVQYDEIRDRLSITVHEARGLKNIDPKGMIDPYSRVYLQPDEKQKLKRKTKIVKNSINPKWQETFDYSMTQQEALTKTLIVNLKDERGFFEKPEAKFLGEIVIKLKSVPEINYPFTRWYYLQTLNSCANILAGPNGTQKI